MSRSCAQVDHLRTQRIESFFTILIYFLQYIYVFITLKVTHHRTINHVFLWSRPQSEKDICWVQRFLASLSIAGSGSDWSGSDWLRSDLGSAVWSDRQGVNDGDHEAVAFHTGGRFLGPECRELPLRCSGRVVASLLRLHDCVCCVCDAEWLSEPTPTRAPWPL